LLASLLQAGYSSLREQAASEAKQVTQLVCEQGDRYLQQRKSRVADELERIGEAVQLSADKLHDGNIDALAGYADSAAQGIDRMARFLEQRDLRDIGGELERLARRRPAVVMTAMFLSGLALGRFIKSGLSQR
jgi:hypothetical protein